MRIKDKDNEDEKSEKSDNSKEICGVSHRYLPPKYMSKWKDDVDSSAKNKNIVIETSTLQQAKWTKAQASKANPPKKIRKKLVIDTDEEEEEEESIKLTRKKTQLPRQPPPDESSESEDSSPCFKTSMVL